MDNNLIPIEFRQTECNSCPIRRHALFKGVPHEELDWTQKFRSAQFKVKAKQLVFSQKQSSDYIYTLYHGWLMKFKTLDNGKRQVIRVSLPGDLIGFQSDFNGLMQYSAIALSDVILCAFPRKNISEMFGQDLGLAKRLTEMHARDMSICQHHLLGIGQKTAEERLAYLCAEIYFRIKLAHDDSLSNDIEFLLTQEDLGDAAGLTQIHVNRTLKTLREKGLMEIRNKRLIIHDEAGLKRLGSFDENVLTVHDLF